MPVTNPTNFLDTQLVETLMKAGVFIVLGLYVIFSLVVLRQTAILSKSLITPSSPIIRAFFIVHVGLAIGLIILSVGIL